MGRRWDDGWRDTSGVDEEREQGGSGEKTYLAAMEPFGEEAERRILRHRRLRQGKGFETVERPREIEKAAASCRGTVLLETLSVLLANEMFAGETLDESAGERILSGVRLLYAEPGISHLVMVSDAIFSGASKVSPETAAYQKALGSLHRLLAAEADFLVEVSAGIPIIWKDG